MSYCAYLRDGQFLSVINEDEAVSPHLTECQRHTLLRAFETAVDYQRTMAQYPRTAVIEV